MVRSFGLVKLPRDGDGGVDPGCNDTLSSPCGTMKERKIYRLMQISGCGHTGSLLERTFRISIRNTRNKTVHKGTDSPVIYWPDR